MIALLLAPLAPVALLAAEPDPGAEALKREIDVRLEVPAREQADYAKRLDAALVRAVIEDARPQYVLLIDRSPRYRRPSSTGARPRARFSSSAPHPRPSDAPAA